MCCKNSLAVKYEITSTVRQIEDVGPVTVFGIRCCTLDPVSQSPQTACWIKDISNLPDFVADLCKRLEMEHVPLTHFVDIVEDFLPWTQERSNCNSAPFFPCNNDLIQSFSHFALQFLTGTPVSLVLVLLQPFGLPLFLVLPKGNYCYSYNGVIISSRFWPARQRHLLIL